MNKEPFPLAYFITWTTYGSWLPGDERGWVKKGTWIVQTPDPELRRAAEETMTDETVILTPQQRALLDSVIVKHCEIRGWILHARNVRTSHIHVVVSAAKDGEDVRSQLKAWCSRSLSEQKGLSGTGKNGQCRWFTEGGDIEWIEDEEHLASAIIYVNEQQ